MAVTRPRARGAGSGSWLVAPNRARRAVLGGLWTGLAALAGCRGAPGPERAVTDPVSPQPNAPWRFLVPLLSVHGGFTLAPAPVLGMWSPPPGAFFSLRGPITAAARGADLVIADAGHDLVLRFDVVGQTLQPLLGTGTRPGMKLCVFGDRSVLILDPTLGRLLRVAPDGRQLARLQDPWLLAGARDLALEDSSGMIWLADSGAGRVLAVRPALNAAVPVPLASGTEEAVGSLSALATGPDALYAIEPARRRVLRLDRQGRVMQVFGGDVLRQPRAIAVDRHRRVYVTDGMDRSLHLFRGGRHEGSFAAQSFGATEFSDLRVQDDELVIADAPGGRVHLFRVLPEEPVS